MNPPPHIYCKESSGDYRENAEGEKKGKNYTVKKKKESKKNDRDLCLPS